MKYNSFYSNSDSGNVAPSTGAWIEILLPAKLLSMFLVAPSAGAWIEIEKKNAEALVKQLVAPSAGAWIEIGEPEKNGIWISSRSLRGSVD